MIRIDAITPRGSAGSVLIVRISYDFAVLTVQTAARCDLPGISFFVVTGLALIHEVLRVQADLWVVAVLIVQPYLVVYYQARLVVTYFTQPTIQCHPLVNISLPSHAPGFGLIELFLVHTVGLLAGSHPSTSPAYAIPAEHSAAIHIGLYERRKGPRPLWPRSLH